MTTTLNPFVAEAEQLASVSHQTEPAWLAEARQKALTSFNRLGFPTTRDEEWRFTSVAPIADGSFTLARQTAALTGADVEAYRWLTEPTITLVFVDGVYRQELSSLAGVPADVQIGSLAAARSERVLERHLTTVADAQRQAFTALNTAFLTDGLFVSIPDGVIVRTPIHALFITSSDAAPTMVHPRVLIVLGAHSQASIIESYESRHRTRSFTNVVTEVVAGENASLHHYKLQRESSAGFHIGAIAARAARNAALVFHSVSLGGALVRNDVTIRLDGEGATCTLNGVYLTDGSRLVDNHTTIDHAQPHCDSREVYRGVLADKSRAVFNGKIVVRQDAQKTDAKQTSKALLLSPDAQINTKPELEIFANDVKCTHGAAVGQMDDEAIFYLRARGLDEGEARHMLIRAFAGEVLNQIPIESLRTRLDRELVQRLPEWTR
jgi:Fe-S cluster assembly protein SufD